MRLSQWFTTQRLALVAFISVTGLAVASTKMVDLIITNSTINSTTIGAIAPSTGNFTTLRAGSPIPNPTAINSSYMGWNAQGQGESDFINNHGTGGGNAFSWYTASSASPNYNPGAALMSLTQSGTLNVSAGVNAPLIQASTQVGGPIGVFGVSVAGSSNTGPSASNVQGLYDMWNLSGGVGESDFVNNKGAGIGGFRWYLGGLGNLPGTMMMSMAADGSLTNTHGFHGNADSATQLNHTPLNCGGNIGATGIQINGDANCNSWPSSMSSAGYTTLPGGVILQWKQGTVQADAGGSGNPRETITYPVNCPNGILSAQVTTVVTSETEGDDTHGPTEVLVSAGNSSAQTQRYRLADHGSDPSSPMLFVICH